jgi:hypothetical protein
MLTNNRIIFLCFDMATSLAIIAKPSAQVRGTRILGDICKLSPLTAIGFLTSGSFKVAV